MRYNRTIEETFTQQWVNRCQFQHSQGPFGENLWMTSDPNIADGQIFEKISSTFSVANLFQKKHFGTICINQDLSKKYVFILNFCKFFLSKN